MLADIKLGKLVGCREVIPHQFKDIRGSLTKMYASDFFNEHGMPFTLQEEFFTVSNKDVIRAMHFQLPPSAHVKIVFCICGKIMDVLMDLRKGSPTYGQHETFTLDSDTLHCLYIPEGIAHGYLVQEDHSVVIYKTSSLFDTKLDAGIAWDSCGIEWGIKNPILAEKDKQLIQLEKFDSPFVYNEKRLCGKDAY